MLKNNIQKVEIDGELTTVLEPVSHGEKGLWIRMWLNGEMSTKKLLKEI
jgi:hypothetical protein